MVEHSARPFTNRLALVTGASRLQGIGAAICETLAARGADIAFTHFNPADRELFDTPANEPAQIAERLKAHNVQVQPVEIDLSQPDAAPRLMDEVNGTLGPVTILVNNAAWSTRDGYEALDAETLDRHYAVNLRTTALLAVEFARRFSGESSGRIINLTSGQELGAMVGELAYAATKGAIVAFTRTLAAEVAAKGITVNAVNPGVTDTGWITPELREALLPKMPFGRFGTPQDAANLIAWLASDDAGWITGQVITSEGGYLRG